MINTTKESIGNEATKWKKQHEEEQLNIRNH